MKVAIRKNEGHRTYYPERNLGVKEMLKNIVKMLIFGGIIIMAQQCSHQDYEEKDGFNKVENSKNYKDGKFLNNIPTPMFEKGKFWEMTKKYIRGGQKPKRPATPIPIVRLTKNDFHNPPSEELTLVWLGHSSVLIEFEGKRYLLDPIFSERASFVQWAGPKRFHPPPLNARDMPELDGIIISHNHYDHLDRGTIEALSERDLTFYVPLGIKKILMSWGIKANRIAELDWWDEVRDGKIMLASTPARHFSGRGLFDRNETQWCSWVLVGQKHRIYFSGDTGMSPAFEEIGGKYGPFDVTLLKIGASDETWSYIHINPEEAVQAHIRLRGKRLVPIHWSTFDLGLHSWYDPAERLQKAAESANVDYSIPRPGEVISLTNLENDRNWWKALK